MPLISGDGLSQTVAELSRRRVKLCHACQLADFKSYLQVGGIPSRNLLAIRELSYTAFDTDGRDGDNGVWRLVFFNLSDFGHWFAKGGNNLPNIYGPILLCFDPKVITQALDISITLRSASAKDFDRVAEGIGVDQVTRLFINSGSGSVRFRHSLAAEFSHPDTQDPEMNCSFRDELAPLSHLAYIRVDPYIFPKGSLTDIVHQIAEERGKSCKVFVRDFVDGCEARYQVLMNAILSGVRMAPELMAVIPDGSPLSNWRDAIMRSGDLSFQFGRYARYLSEGTIRHCV